MNCSNGLTDPKVKNNAAMPPVMPNDFGAMCMAVRKGNPFDEALQFIRIKDILSMDKLLVSPAVLELIRHKPEYTVVEEPNPIRFDEKGNLEDFATVWDAF